MEATYVEKWGLWAVRAKGQEVFVAARNESEALVFAQRRMEARHG